ncbi:MAG: histidinol-phosphate transaminase [Proteobacteria bacterium]|nr:histidinol-phosphate transaminase [Pseudomonadota bacterium]
MSRYQRPNIQRMDGYRWGEQPQGDQCIKLNTNENPYPPSPAVSQALTHFSTAALRTYPQPTADQLREQIAQLHGLEKDQVVVTHAGDEALRLAITTFVSPGGTFASADPSYSLYPVLAQIQDARIVSVELNDDWSLPVSFAQTVNTEDAQLTCLVNPHAPSGQLTAASQLHEIANSINGVLLIDEAYADFVDPSIGYQSQEFVQQHDNVLVLRTFSKGYSLAGLRLGYLLGDAELIAPILEKTRDSYNVDAISQSLGLAALQDQNYAQSTWRQVREQRQLLVEALNQLGWTSLPSETNFVLTTPPSNGVSAAHIYQQLKDANILVRYFDHPRLQDKLRISIGTAEQNHRLLECLQCICS